MHILWENSVGVAMRIKCVDGDGLHEADGDPLEGGVLDAELAMGFEFSRADIQVDVVRKQGSGGNGGWCDVFDEGQWAGEVVCVEDERGRRTEGEFVFNFKGVDLH